MQLCGSSSILWDWNEYWPFPVLWPLLSFPNLLHIECSTFTAPSSRIWNSSTGFPSPPLALFAVTPPEAHLPWHSGCLALGEWSHDRGYLGHEDLFCIVLLCILATFCLISSASVRSIPFLSFIEPLFARNIPLVSLIFMKRSLVFLILLFSSISLHWTLRKAF